MRVSSTTRAGGKNIRDRLSLSHSTPAQIKGGFSYMKTVLRGAQYILGECGPLR